MTSAVRKRRWWIRVPLFLVLLPFLAVAGLFLQEARPIMSIGRGLSSLDDEQRAAALIVADLAASESWLIPKAGLTIFAGMSGGGPISLACQQNDELYLSAVGRIVRDGGYDTGSGLCNPNDGLVIGRFYGAETGLYADRARGPDDDYFCPVVQYDSFDIGSVTLLWRTATAIC